jgi:hypothetical protein
MAGWSIGGRHNAQNHAKQQSCMQEQARQLTLTNNNARIWLARRGDRAPEECAPREFSVAACVCKADSGAKYGSCIKHLVCMPACMHAWPCLQTYFWMSSHVVCLALTPLAPFAPNRLHNQYSLATSLCRIAACVRPSVPHHQLRVGLCAICFFLTHATELDLSLKQPPMVVVLFFSFSPARILLSHHGRS